MKRRNFLAAALAPFFAKVWPGARGYGGVVHGHRHPAQIFLGTADEYVSVSPFKMKVIAGPSGCFFIGAIDDGIDINAILAKADAVTARAILGGK